MVAAVAMRGRVAVDGADAVAAARRHFHCQSVSQLGRIEPRVAARFRSLSRLRQPLDSVDVVEVLRSRAPTFQSARVERAAVAFLDMAEELLTVAEVAAELKMNQQSIRNWI